MPPPLPQIDGPAPSSLLPLAWGPHQRPASLFCPRLDGYPCCQPKNGKIIDPVWMYVPGHTEGQPSGLAKTTAYIPREEISYVSLTPREITEAGEPGRALSYMASAAPHFRASGFINCLASMALGSPPNLRNRDL